MARVVCGADAPVTSDFAKFWRRRNCPPRHGAWALYTGVVERGRFRAPQMAREEQHMARKATGLDGRHRDVGGRIDKKHGNTKIGALRKTYGEHFAAGRRSDMMLKTLLAETKVESLHAYLRKHHK
jgi:hypothetical protein